MANKEYYDEEDPAVVTGSNPAKEQDVEETKDVDSQDLEDQMANEDFQAGEEADKAAPKSDEEDQEDETDKGGDEEDEGEDQTPSQTTAQATPQAAGQPTAFQGLLNAVRSGGFSNQDLRAAQAQRDRNIALAQLQQSGALVGRGLSGANVDTQLAMAEESMKRAGQPVEDFAQLVANQQNDPDSPMSQVMKNYLTQKGFQVPDGASAADLLKVAPYLAKDQALQTQLQKTMFQESQKNIRAAGAQQVKKETAAASREQRDRLAKEANELKEKQIAAYAEAQKARTGSMNDRKMQSRFDTYAKAIREGGGPVINQNRQDYLRASKIFIDAGVDPKSTIDDVNKIPNSKLDQLNKMNVVEAALGVNKYFSGSGVPAQSTLDKLVPNNRSMDATKITDYINNKLNPAQQHSAMKAYLQIAARGRDFAKKNVENHLKTVMAQGDAPFKAFPEQTKLMTDELKAQGFDVDPTNAKNVSKAQLSAYAKQHNIDEDKARDLLTQGGYKVE